MYIEFDEKNSSIANFLNLGERLIEALLEH